VERMRQRYGLNDGSNGGISKAGGGRATTTSPQISSIEEELQSTLQKVDIKDWDYKAVPRDRLNEDD